MSHMPSEYLVVGKCINHLYQHPIDIDGHKDAEEVAAYSPQVPNYDTDPSSGKFMYTNQQEKRGPNETDYLMGPAVLHSFSLVGFET